VAHINDYQQEEFARYGVKRRDPMFMTAMTLLELESFPSVESLTDYCGALDLDMEGQRESIQWLFDGMTDQDLQRATEPASKMFKIWPEVCTLRTARGQRAGAERSRI
jgi:hypothetical protein